MTSTDRDRDAAERFLQADKFFQALEIYNRLVAMNPSDSQAWVGVGMVMVRTLQWAQAAETFRFVLQLEARNPIALHGLSMALNFLGDQQSACEMADAACLAAPADWRIHQWRASVYATTEGDPARTLQLYTDWGRRFADPVTARALPLPKLTEAQKKPARRLKVGYVSGDLRQHSVAFFMEPVFLHHNSSEVDVFVYSTGQRDFLTERISANISNWFDVFDMGDEELFKLIRKHQIDVLVDLSGHTVGHRLFVFARRAAPVQVTWMGFMRPLGMKAMDYRLGDSINYPLGSEHHYSEILFRLDCMASYSPPSDVALVPDPPMLAHGHPTLISLNNSKKVTDEMLGVWKEILDIRSDAHLVLMVQEIDQEKALAQMMPRLQKLSLPLNRVHISKQLSLDDFMALGGVADIALDTSPISGGTTTLHALWMGLPVVAMKGKDATSGSSASALEFLGCGDWSVGDRSAYVGKVLALIDAPDLLGKHRKTIRQRMRDSLLMDYAERTAELERAYRLMWINHLLGEPRYLNSRHDLQAAILETAPESAGLK